MKIEMTFDEYRTFYPPFNDMGKVLLVNNKECTLIYTHVNCNQLPEYPYVSETMVTLYFEFVEVKSPQEIAAEEVVQKAESALKAAKDVLKTVKEK